MRSNLPIRVALGLFASVSIIAGCSGGETSYRSALQKELDAHRDCLDVADMIRLPKDKNLGTETVRYGATVPKYEADELRKGLRGLQDGNIIRISSEDSRETDAMVLVPPVRFDIALAITAVVAPYLDDSGRRICRKRTVAEMISLGEPFEKEGETYRKGRFKLEETGPEFPKTGVGAFQDLVLGLAAASGRRIDLNRIEALFREGKGGPVLVAAEPIVE